MGGGLFKVVGVAALLAGGGAAGAETLRGALVQTYQSNPTLNAERANVRTSDEAVAIARAQGRPQVSGAAGVSLTEAVGAYMDGLRDRTIVTLHENEGRVLETKMQATKDRFEVGDLTRT